MLAILGTPAKTDLRNITDKQKQQTLATAGRLGIEGTETPGVRNSSRRLTSASVLPRSWDARDSKDCRTTSAFGRRVGIRKNI